MKGWRGAWWGVQDELECPKVSVEDCPVEERHAVTLGDEKEEEEYEEEERGKEDSFKCSLFISLCLSLPPRFALSLPLILSLPSILSPPDSLSLPPILSPLLYAVCLFLSLSLPP